jgi:hypothetical protein
MDHRTADCVNHRTAPGVIFRGSATWRFFLIGLGIVVLPEVGTGLGQEEAAAQAREGTEEKTGENRPATASSPAPETPAAAATRLRLARVKVRGSFQDARLGDILKEFAQQAEEQTGEPVLWTYAPGFPAQVRIQVELAEQSLLQALDQVLTAGSKASQQNLGYVVLSLPDHKHDGWVRLTTNGERGKELPAATAEEEQQAQERLATAQKLLAENKPAAAKIYLEVVVKKYPTTAAARQARLLLEKIGP